MKSVTKCAAAAKSIGKPESEMAWEGTLQEVLKELIQWTLQTEMPKRFQICFARTKDEALSQVMGSKAKTAKQQSFDELMEESGFNDLLLAYEPESKEQPVTPKTGNL